MLDVSFYIFIEKLFFKKINAKIIWNIRHSNFTKYQIKQKIGLLILGVLSRLKRSNIIYCVLAAKKYHELICLVKSMGKLF